MVTTQILSFIERLIGMKNGSFDIAPHQRRNTDTDRDVSCDAFIEHMGNFEIVNILSDAFRYRAGGL